VKTARASTSVSSGRRLRLSKGVRLAMTGLALAGVAAGCGQGRRTDRRAVRVEPSAVSRPRPRPSSQAPRVVHSIDRSQRDHFALLRGMPEPLPASVRRVLRKPTYGMNWALAQRLPLSLRGLFWLVPGRHVLCLLHAETIHEASSACASTKTALAHGVVAVSLREASPDGPAERLVIGVVPDGASKAVVHTGGETARVAITDHLLVLRDSMSEPPDLVSLH
jgi:hypothetical protein